MIQKQSRVDIIRKIHLKLKSVFLHYSKGIRIPQPLVLALTAALLVAYWALLTFVPPPGGVAGDLTPSGNLGAWLDRAVFGT